MHTAQREKQLRMEDIRRKRERTDKRKSRKGRTEGRKGDG